MKKLLLSVLLIIISSSTIIAKDYILGKSTFSIDDSYTLKKYEHLYFYAEKGSSFALMKILETSKDVSYKKVLSSLDTIMYNISDYKVYDTKKEPFYRWAENYVIRYYSKEGSSDKIITYTSYSKREGYAFLAFCDSDSAVKEAEAAIESIKIHDTGLFFIQKAPVWWLFFSIFLMIMSIVIGEKSASFWGYVWRAFIYLLFITPLLVLVLWGSFNFLITALIGTFILLLIGKFLAYLFEFVG